jgi:pimeloyl-ACP methyl ester carboxylesterase
MLRKGDLLVSDPDGVLRFLEEIERDSRSRPTFDLNSASDFARKPVRLSTGSAPEKLICVPALLALCGPQQFARFGQGFRGIRETLVLHIPGFVDGEWLPASLDIAIAYQVSAVEAAIGRDTPLILAGYSSGGIFAYRLASQLEARGRQVSAVVLLDTYPPRPDGVLTKPEAAAVQHLLSNREWHHYLNETRLTAMGWYLRVVAELELRPVMASTLLLRAGQPMATGDGDDWRASWPFPHEASDVSGDHYSMMELNAWTAAQTVESWLRLKLGGSAENPALDQRRAVA